jgi:hypothetical protein
MKPSMFEDIVTPEIIQKAAHDSSIIQQIEMILLEHWSISDKVIARKSTIDTAEEIFNLCKK